MRCRSMRRRSASVEKPDVAGTASARDSIVEATPPSGDQITPPIFELSGSTTSSTLSPGSFTSCCLFKAYYFY